MPCWSGEVGEWVEVVVGGWGHRYESEGSRMTE